MTHLAAGDRALTATSAGGTGTGPARKTGSRPDHDRLYELAASQAGHFTSRQAADCGFSPPLLSAHVRSGRFLRVARGVYRLRLFPDSPHEPLILALLLLGPAAVISHGTALAFHGLSDPVPEAVHVTVPRSMRWKAGRIPRWIRLHTACRPLPEEDIVRRGPVRVTSPARSIVDAAELGEAPEQVFLAIRQALRRGLATAGELRGSARNRSARVRKLVELGIREAEGELRHA